MNRVIRVQIGCRFQFMVWLISLFVCITTQRSSANQAFLPKLTNIALPIPWAEDWTTNNLSSWSLEPPVSNWQYQINSGNPLASVTFSGTPQQANYNSDLVSPWLNAGIFTCADIWLEFDIKLESLINNGLEKLNVEVYNGNTWKTMAIYKNSLSFGWLTKSININHVAGDSLRIRFRANGMNSSSILNWNIDNIRVYPNCRKPANLSIISNTAATAKLVWNSPDCNTILTGTNVLLNQWQGDPTVMINSYYQQYGFAYGVVFNLSEYPLVIFKTIDFHQAAWGMFGIWNYNVHMVDWNSKSLMQSYGPYSTTGNDQWETNVSLNNYIGQAVDSVAVLIEPLSNNPTDAYPVLSADGDASDGVSVFGPLANLNSFSNSMVGDFYLNLRIQTNLKGNQVFLSSFRSGRFNYSREISEISSDEKQSYTVQNSNLQGYNIYYNENRINQELINDTFFVIPNPGFDDCYRVSAVYTSYDSICESGLTNEVCGLWTALSNLISDEDIYIFPNPVYASLNIRSRYPIKNIKILNLMGLCVVNHMTNHEFDAEINVESLKPGINYVRIEIGVNRCFVKKILVNK